MNHVRSLVVAVLVTACSSLPSLPADGGTGGGTGGGGTGGGGTGGGVGGGTGGAGDGGALSCTARVNAYRSTVEAAKACNTTSLINPCTVTRPSIIVCGCPTFIEAGRTAGIDLAEAQFTGAGCMMQACPDCLPLDAGSCQPVDGGQPSEGICTDHR